MKTLLLGAALLLTAPALASAQRPDTRFFEDLTFDELRDAIRAGARNVIIPTGGTEDGGDRIVTGRPTDVATYAAERIARRLGNTFVAPVIPYSPGGVIPLRAEVFAELLEAAATSVKGSGFKNIFLLGEAAGSQPVLKAVAEKLDATWKADGVRVAYVADYYVAQRRAGPLGAGGSSSVSELLAINSQRVRIEKLTGDAGAGSAQQGLAHLNAKVDAAVAQVRSALAEPGKPGPLRPGASGPAVAAASTFAKAPADESAAASSVTGPRVLPTPDPRATSSSGLFIEDLTSAEIRESIAAGRTVVIVPTGGTEKNGFHMALGKHNFHVRAGAELMARRLGNALVAPVLQYVPEGQATEASPGVLSCARDCFEHVVESIARSVRQLGFADVLLIGDNGGNQTPLRTVAERLNREWEGSGARAFALTDFYDKGHEYQDVWFLSQFGWDEAVVGSHAGIKDTSQLLFVKPQSVRTGRIADSFANRGESSISGDPTKATAEFGRIGIEFKANGAMAQYRRLKALLNAGAEAPAHELRRVQGDPAYASMKPRPTAHMTIE